MKVPIKEHQISCPSNGGLVCPPLQHPLPSLPTTKPQVTELLGVGRDTKLCAQDLQGLTARTGHPYLPHRTLCPIPKTGLPVMGTQKQPASGCCPLLSKGEQQQREHQSQRKRAKGSQTQACSCRSSGHFATSFPGPQNSSPDPGTDLQHEAPCKPAARTLAGDGHTLLGLASL